LSVALSGSLWRLLLNVDTLGGRGTIRIDMEAILYFPVILNICVLAYAVRFEGTRARR
jgi:hypothetical protein